VRTIQQFIKIIALGLILGCSQEITTNTTQPSSTSAPSTLAQSETLSTDPAKCGECHAKEFTEWKGSRHAQAFLDGVFQHEFNPKRQVWCIKCHSPLVPDAYNVDDKDPLVTQGVGCLGCHQREKQLVSASKREGSPHQTLIDPKFGTHEFCGPCHDFNFPLLDKRGELKRYTPHPMQETWRQYKRSKITLGCLDCHTPHESKGAHDIKMLHEALDFVLCKDKTSIKLGFFNKGAGHYVPSGGIDRHMMVEVWPEGKQFKKLRALMGRKFERVPSGGKRVIEDTSVKPKQWQWFSAPINKIPFASTKPIVAQVRYIYAPNETLKVENATISQVIFEEKLFVKDITKCTETIEAAKEMKPPEK
jgi:nitrate reductase cytochrome c-type subunit